MQYEKIIKIFKKKMKNTIINITQNNTIQHQQKRKKKSELKWVRVSAKSKGKSLFVFNFL